jgi:hypothetical protein
VNITYIVYNVIIISFFILLIVMYSCSFLLLLFIIYFLLMQILGFTLLDPKPFGPLYLFSYIIPTIIRFSLYLDYQKSWSEKS